MLAFYIDCILDKKQEFTDNLLVNLKEVEYILNAHYNVYMSPVVGPHFTDGSNSISDVIIDWVVLFWGHGFWVHFSFLPIADKNMYFFHEIRLNWINFTAEFTTESYRRSKYYGHWQIIVDVHIYKISRLNVTAWYVMFDLLMHTCMLCVSRNNSRRTTDVFVFYRELQIILAFNRRTNLLSFDDNSPASLLLSD